MSLTTLSKVKAWIGIGDSADDGLLAALILNCDAAVKSLLDRHLEAANYTEQVDGSGTDELLLPQYPINSIAEVKVSAHWLFSAVTAEDADSISFADMKGILYRRSRRWPEGRLNVRVTWNAGYATLPDDVVQAANMIVADWYTRAKQLASGQAQNEMLGENLKDRAEQYRPEGTEWGIPAPAKALLSRYVKTF